MTLTNAKRIYWTGVALTSLWFGASGFFELTKNPVVWDITLKLGYPAYFIYVLRRGQIIRDHCSFNSGQITSVKRMGICGDIFRYHFRLCLQIKRGWPGGYYRCYYCFHYGERYLPDVQETLSCCLS
jgi:hypothetical protein